MKTSIYNGVSGEGGAGNERFRRDYEFYMTPQPYRAIPSELSDRVYSLYNHILREELGDILQLIRELFFSHPKNLIYFNLVKLVVLKMFLNNGC